MIVNGLNKHELKHIRRSLVCAASRLHDQWRAIKFNRVRVSERDELLAWYGTGYNELMNMIQFADKAIKVSKQ